MNNHTGTSAEIQERNFEPGHFPQAQVERYPGRLRLATGAGNEIRVTWSEDKPVGIQAGRDVAEVVARLSAKRLLVYSDKLQPLATGVDKRRSRKKTLGLTTYAKRTIREGCAVMRDEFAKEVAFITLTLPGSTKDALRVFGEQSAGIRNAFMEQIRKAFKRKHADEGHTKVSSPIASVEDLFQPANDEPELLATAVWEPQKRGALHLHIAVGMPDKKLYKHIKREHRRWWRQILEHYSDKTGVDLFAKETGGTWRGIEWACKTECNKVKKDVGAYLSKYVSKLAQATLAEDGSNPAKWWYISKPLFQQLRNERVEKELPTEGVRDAEADGHAVAFVGMLEATSHYKMLNPFTGNQCGYVLYYQPDEKEGAWVRMTEFLERQNDELVAPTSGSDIWWGPDWEDEEETLAESLISAGMFTSTESASGAGVALPSPM